MQPPHQRPTERPRLTVTSLAEYLVASPVRRAEILEEQKARNETQITYFREAQDAIVAGLTTGNVTNAVDTAIATIEARGHANDWERQRRNANAEALRTFRDYGKQVPLKGFKILRAPRSQRMLEIAGVAVRVRPELLLAGKIDGEVVRGAIKLLFFPSDPLSAEGGRFLCSLLHQHMEANFAGSMKADHRACFNLDVFGHDVAHAPGTYKKRRAEAEAACLEIARLWAYYA